MPTELVCTIRPLPGIRLRRPGGVDVVQYVVALVRPPGTLGVCEKIGASLCGTCSLVCGGTCLPRNAERLIGVDEAGIRQVIGSGDLLPVCSVSSGNATERVSADHGVGLVGGSARGCRPCVVGPDCGGRKEQEQRPCDPGVCKEVARAWMLFEVVPEPCAFHEDFAFR